jgi:hypothetical protein
MAIFSIAALQALPETEPSVFHEEFGLRPCTVSCKESCGWTCGSLSCTHTVGVTAEEESMNAAVLAAQKALTGQAQTGQAQTGQAQPS